MKKVYSAGKPGMQGKDGDQFALEMIMQVEKGAGRGGLDRWAKQGPTVCWLAHADLLGNNAACIRAPVIALLVGSIFLDLL